MLEGRDRILLRQPDLDAIVQDEVPATLPDPDGRPQLARWATRKLRGGRQALGSSPA